MPENLVHISARIRQETRDDLDEMVRKRRMKAGEDVRRADLIRTALEEYVKHHRA
jgi:metal-responsive CopG/Arc/MetJ family transcriptional regulator